ncbi:MAG: ABC transporter permease subunit [Clostridium sp.]
MLFTLVKNELRKIVRKGKTWVVFGLFLLLTIGLNTVMYFEAKNMEYNMSPEGRIQSLNEQITWRERDLQYLSEKDDKEYLESVKLEIVSLKEEIKEQEKRKSEPVNPDQWKLDLKSEKEKLTEELNNEDRPEDSKKYLKNRLEEIKMIEDAGIKPTEHWGFEPYNNAKNFIQVLGLIILVAGIAVFMSDIVSGEATPPTLKFLLVQPISRGKVIFSKFIAITLTVVSMIAGLELLAFGVVGAMSGFDGGKMPVMIGQKYKEVMDPSGYMQIQPVEGSATISTMSSYITESFLLQLLFIVACCAFVFLISTLFKSSMITMAVSVIITVASTMVSTTVATLSSVAHLNFLNYGSTTAVFSGEMAYMFNNVNFTPELGAALMVGVIIVCPMIAWFVFNKKDILI